MSDSGSRVLILASSRKDIESTQHLFTRFGIECVETRTVENLVAQIERGAGMLLLAKESLDENTIKILATYLNQQPRWSFLPIALLTNSGDLTRGSNRMLELLRPLRNMTFLERPVRIGTLISVVQAALNDRKRQYELRDVLAELEVSKINAIAANEAKTTFLANMSHEIRTPLGAIIGFSDLLLEPRVSVEEKKTYMETIRRNGQLLSSLIDDILDLAKVEAGQISVEYVDVSVRELVSDVISALKPRAVSKGIELNVQWKDNTPLVISTDPLRLKQILINIIGNALKFTADGSVSIEISQSGDRIKFSVTDTGIGITQAQAESLFRPFAQADSSVTRRFGGTGLGLALSRKLAESLNGNIELRSSEIGTGSRFEITVGIGQPKSTAITSEKVLPPSISQLHGCHVLVVDDSKDNQTLLSHILSLAGANVATADDGISGMEKALSGNFDVILMDIQMPRLGGHEATLQLRARGYSKPIIALTAHAMKEDRDRSLAVGCNAYLTKPVDRNLLLEAVANACADGSRKSSFRFVESMGE